MPTPKTTKLPNGTQVHWYEYTDIELVNAWYDVRGQGNIYARNRGPACIIHTCTQDEAIELSRMFVRTVFAIPTCCHYDGNTVSLYCGDAGRNYQRTMEKAKELIKNITKKEVPYHSMESS